MWFNIVHLHSINIWINFMGEIWWKKSPNKNTYSIWKKKHFVGWYDVLSLGNLSENSAARYILFSSNLPPNHQPHRIAKSPASCIPSFLDQGCRRQIEDEISPLGLIRDPYNGFLSYPNYPKLRIGFSKKKKKPLSHQGFFIAQVNLKVLTLSGLKTAYQKSHPRLKNVGWIRSLISAWTFHIFPSHLLQASKESPSSPDEKASVVSIDVSGRKVNGNPYPRKSRKEGTLHSCHLSGSTILRKTSNNTRYHKS